MANDVDAELLRAWRGGNAEAGNELVRRNFMSVYRFFVNKASEDVDDLIQRTFLACVESRDKFRGESSFRTYIFGVAHNVLGKHFRSKRRHGDRIDFGVTSVHDLSPSPSVVVAKHREQRLLLEALRRIPLEHQVVLELYYWERLPAPEVANIVGCPEGTARTRIRRAKQLLVEEMEKLEVNKEQLNSTIVNLEGWAEGLREQLLDDSEPK